MDKELLIKKWLDNNLNATELETFKKLEDYDSLVKLSDNIKHFKAMDFESNKELEAVLQKIKAQKATKNNWIKPLLRVAAVLAVCFSVYFYTTNLDTTVNTLVAQKTNIELPDASEVQLNAESKLAYNKKSWNKKRDIELDGEAYFKVAKGSTFNVITKSGTVTVLGTQFNVKHRDNYFEVVCFEGSVGVKYEDNSVTLKPGYSFLIINGDLYAKDKDTRTEPSWIHNESYFKSLPYKEVLREFERQYNVTFETKDLDSNQLFTGTFEHNNIELALKSVTLPLNLKYQLKNDTTIVLSRE